MLLYCAQSSLCITRLNVHKKRKAVSSVVIGLGKPYGLNIERSPLALSNLKLHLKVSVSVAKTEYLHVSDMRSSPASSY